MALIKQNGNRWNVLLQNENERNNEKLLKWDSVKKIYYTDDELILENFSDDIKEANDALYNYSSAVKTLLPQRVFPEIYDFQERGVFEMDARINRNGSVLLADEPGLGKTIQAIKYIQLKTVGMNTTLIICPASLKINWKKELQVWGGPKATSQSIDIINSSKHKFESISFVRYYIINYDLLAKKEIQEQLQSINFTFCVYDEAHYLKNPLAIRSKSAYALTKNIPVKIFITGTPVLNRPVELYSLLKLGNMLRFMKPYNNYDAFTKRYCNAYYGNWGMDVSGASNVEELNRRLRTTVMIRRKKIDVLSDLPLKQYQIIPLTQDSKSKAIIKNMGALDMIKIKEQPELGNIGDIARLRQQMALAKLDDSIAHIKNIMFEKEKVVIFAYHKAVISALSDKLNSYNPVIYDGGCNQIDKNKAIEKFTIDRSCRIFIGQIQAAGVGITLVSADTVIFIESSWVPGEVEQAIDRCHRIGQKNTVTAQFLVVADSIDELMINSVVKKLKIINRIIK